MDIKQRINAFSKLGERLASLKGDELESLEYRIGASNTWFRKESVKSAIDGLIYMLRSESLSSWINRYNIQDQNKKVGIIMAGNIPAVGFHDLFCVVMSGNQALIKLSSQDDVMINFLVTELLKIEPELQSFIHVVDRLNDMDAVIATGSDNTSRYFNYYFSKYPHIIRKNRTSCAVIKGDEQKHEFQNLGADIFQYFGLGCRNISKIYVPKGYKFDLFYEGIQTYEHIIHHHKYNNNYDYNKSIYLVNSEPHFDNGFLLLRKSDQLVSPISVLFYEEYDSPDHLKDLIQVQRDKIQCIVSSDGWWSGSIGFGQAQQPAVDDYADDIDTMAFLADL